MKVGKQRYGKVSSEVEDIRRGLGLDDKQEIIGIGRRKEGEVSSGVNAIRRDQEGMIIARYDTNWKTEKRKGKRRDGRYKYRRRLGEDDICKKLKEMEGGIQYGEGEHWDRK
jgi:hypothetical protein